MLGGSTKEKIPEVIQRLPADATLEDAIERLVPLAKTQRGLAALDAARDTGTLQNDWFFSSDYSEGLVYERYLDSEAFSST